MDFGKILIGLGALLLVFGVVVVIASKAGLPFGRMPGDVVYRGKNTTVYFPIVTSIVLSVVLTLVLWIVQRMRR